MREFLDWLIEVRRLLWVWVAPFPRLGSWTEHKGESELSTSIHLSLIPDYRCFVSSCLMLLSARHPHHDGLCPLSVNQSKALLPFFFWHYIPTTGKAGKVTQAFWDGGFEDLGEGGYTSQTNIYLSTNPYFLLIHRSCLQLHDLAFTSSGTFFQECKAEKLRLIPGFPTVPKIVLKFLMMSEIHFTLMTNFNFVFIFVSFSLLILPFLILTDFIGRWIS